MEHLVEFFNPEIKASWEDIAIGFGIAAQFHDDVQKCFKQILDEIHPLWKDLVSITCKPQKV